VIDFGEHVAEKKTLDLTPMLDVVFLLLIFFMLTSIFAKPMLPLDLPEAASATVVQEPEVSITIQRDGSLYLNNVKTTPADLPADLRALFNTGHSRDLSLQSDQGVPFGRVVEIMDLAKQAGAEKLAVVTERKP
jgi:biopolymer transport protein ExbD